jgi:C4-type Zn-finger protein
LEIPELGLTVGPYALGGRFTTVEGILVAMKEQVTSEGSVFVDSGDEEVKSTVAKFVAELDVVLEGNKEITLVLDDPAGNSYVQVTTEVQSKVYVVWLMAVIVFSGVNFILSLFVVEKIQIY